MKDINGYIESGILEMYVLGNVTTDEATEVASMARLYPEIAAEIKNISASLQQYSSLNAVAPEEAIKAFLLAQIDYQVRIEGGEPVSFPPIISEKSSIADFNKWLKRKDLTAPDILPGLYARIIGHTETMTTAIVWIKKMAPQEVHHDEIEKFLVVEGACEIKIGEDTYQLAVGDTLTIPLHRSHYVNVTSTVPCKVILQRIAA